MKKKTKGRDFIGNIKILSDIFLTIFNTVQLFIRIFVII